MGAWLYSSVYPPPPERRFVQWQFIFASKLTFTKFCNYTIFDLIELMMAQLYDCEHDNVDVFTQRVWFICVTLNWWQSECILSDWRRIQCKKKRNGRTALMEEKWSSQIITTTTVIAIIINGTMVKMLKIDTTSFSLSAKRNFAVYVQRHCALCTLYANLLECGISINSAPTLNLTPPYQLTASAKISRVGYDITEFSVWFFHLFSSVVFRKLLRFFFSFLLLLLHILHFHSFSSSSAQPNISTLKGTHTH